MWICVILCEGEDLGVGKRGGLTAFSTAIFEAEVFLQVGEINDFTA